MLKLCHNTIIGTSGHVEVMHLLPHIWRFCCRVVIVIIKTLSLTLHSHQSGLEGTGDLDMS